MANYNLFDAASLAMIPTGVKEDKVYSIKPTDGSGDLAFSRSNDTATRVNSSGLIEKVRTNLQTYSQDFSNAVWTITNGTATHSQTDPNGGTTATKIVFSAIGTLETTLSGLSTSNAYTLSIYVRSESGSVSFEMGNINGGIYETRTATTSWQRFELTQTPSGSTRYPAWVRSTGATTLYVAFAQAEVSDFGATDYIATTSAAVSVGPVANLPRLDYSGGASCPKLLLEGQRTNTALYSEQADNAYWSKSLCTITANQGTAPDGTMSADLLTTSSTNCVIYRTSVVAGALSFFAKAATLSAGAKFYISVDGVGNAKWNQDGTISSQTGALVAATDGEDYGNGWYRFTFVVGSGSVLNYGLSDSTSGDTAFIWGMQNEASASYATSYIPTLSAASTRGADVGRKIGLGVDDSIGQTEGTIFVDLVYNGSESQTGNIFAFNEDTSGSVVIIRNSNGVVSTAVWDGSGKAGITGGSMPIGQRTKIAYAYKSGSTALFVNGTQIGSDNTDTFSLPLLNEIHLNSSTAYFAFKQDASFNQTLLFKTRLTNAELAALTTI